MARKGKHDYFAAFQRQAELALEEANLLIEVIENFTTADAVLEMIPKAHDIENEADDINHQNFSAIAVDFITPIDRDDILSISQSLDAVTDEIEDVIQEFYMMDVHFMHKDAIRLATLIQQSCEALVRAAQGFPEFKKSSEFKDAVIEVNSVEEQADELYRELIRNLHTIDSSNPMRVLVWSRIFTKMELCTDVAERVADIMASVLMKNS